MIFIILFYLYMCTPAENLVGKTLKNNWNVIEKIDNHTTVNSGGFFSVAYIVEKDGNKAFMKALDFNKVRGADAALQIQRMTEFYNFEKAVLQKCKDRRLSKIIVSLDTGDIGSIANADFVLYIIFELALNDVRVYKSINTTLDYLWIVNTIHSITVGMQQLHQVNLVHQDLKPSNVLILQEKLAKIGDLGRAFTTEFKVPFGDLFAGDRKYAPLEVLYKEDGNDWYLNKLGADSYMLGNMIIFLFTQNNLNTLIFNKLDVVYNYRNWKQTYRDVLPFIINAFDEVIEELKNSIIMDVIKEDVINSIKELCHPDPYKRGNPKQKYLGKPLHDLQKYISLYDRLADIVTLELSKSIK